MHITEHKIIKHAVNSTNSVMIDSIIFRHKSTEAILKYADKNGRVKIEDIVSYFKNFYENRRASGLVVEKPNSIFAKGGYTNKEAERNILSNPFKRFEDMNMLRHTKTLGIIEVDSTVWKNLKEDEIIKILSFCEENLEKYFEKLVKII